MQSSNDVSKAPREPWTLFRVLGWITLIIIILITLFPFWWVLRTALTDAQSVFANPWSLMPVEPTLFNFQRVLGLVDSDVAVSAGGSGQSLNFMLFLRNSIIFATLVTVGQVFFSACAAYAFARLQFPGRNFLFTLYVAALMVPGIVTLIPNFLLMRDLGWIDTFRGMIAPYFLMTPFAVFFLRQFFLGINPEIENAARIDGANPFRIFWSIILPITRPTLLTLAIITFIQSWNEYLWPLIVGKGETVRVLTVALGIFRQQTPQGAPDWAGLMAGTFMGIVPLLILYLIVGRRVLNSIQFTGFK